MGRVYSSSFNGATISAGRDLITLTTPSDTVVRLLSAFIGQSSDAGDAEAEMLTIGITRYASAGTGTANTPRPHNVGHAAAGSTVVTDAANGTTPTELLVETFNVQAGWLYSPVPEEMIWVAPSDVISIELHDAPGDALTMSGRLTFEEID